MRVLLILPDGRIHKIRIGSFVRSMREAPLTLTTLAALAPDELQIEFRLVDESIDTVPMDYAADLVGISVLTGTACRAYGLADHFRNRGITVVLGGVHVTILPEEAAPHADAIVVGPAERVWPKLLRDFACGHLERVYKDDGVESECVAALPIPRRELQRASGYMVPNTVMATRGCRHRCDFCTIPVVTNAYTTRPVEDVIKDIRHLKSRIFAFNDVSLADDVNYAKELFRAMIPFGKRWGGLATTCVAKDPELIELMAQSGCQYLLIGFESFNPAGIAEIHKGFNQEKNYRHLMEALHAHRISVQGTFIFGFDSDDQNVFAETVQRVLDLRIDIPRYSILTPYPGTRLHKRLLAEGRILSHHWADYDTMHVVFQPARMSPQNLYDGFKRAYRETFKLPHILRRLPGLHFAALINLLGNLTYRRFVWRLYNEPTYATPFTPNCGTSPDFAKLETV